MATILKQSTAVDVLIGPFVDLTDGATAETGESPSVKLSKNGQTLAAKNDITTPVHDADGYYNCELDATDTNTVGSLVLTVAASANALPVRHEFQVVEEATYDFLYAASATPIADINAEVDTALTDYDAVVPADLPTNFVDMSITATTGLVDITQAAADKAWSTAARVLTANTNLNDPTAAAIADQVWDELQSGHVTAGSFGEIATEIASILADTGTDGVVLAGTPDVNVAQISGDSTAADRLEEAATSVIVGSVDASPTPTTTAFSFTGLLSHTADATDDHYNGKIVTFLTGALAGQSTDVTDYTGATTLLTVTALTEAPGSGDQFTLT